MRQATRGGRWRHAFVALAMAGTAAGCGGDARVELSAADALTATARQIRIALDEYHAEVERYDDRREADVARAFVERVKRDAADAAALETYTAAFESALAKIRADRRVESERRMAAQGHVDAMEEVATGLRQIGVASLGLADELQRYVYAWLDRRSNAQSTTADTGNTNSASAASATSASP